MVAAVAMLTQVPDKCVESKPKAEEIILFAMHYRHRVDERFLEDVKAKVWENNQPSRRRQLRVLLQKRTGEHARFHVWHDYVLFKQVARDRQIWCHQGRDDEVRATPVD